MATNPLKPIRHKPPAWVTETLTALVLLFLGATALMLGMEHAHSIWLDVPPIGYGDAFFLLLYIDIVVNGILFGVRVKVMRSSGDED